MRIYSPVLTDHPTTPEELRVASVCTSEEYDQQVLLPISVAAAKLIDLPHQTVLQVIEKALFSEFVN